MKLTSQNIFEISLGAAEAEERPEGLILHRFTREQRELYVREKKWEKETFMSGVRLHFRTDSRYLELAVNVSEGSTRSFFAIDVSVDGRVVGSINNYDGLPLPVDYHQLSFRLGDFRRKFDLGKGEKLVSVHFPYSVKTALKDVILDDGSTVIPSKQRGRFIAFGDSITQGFDCLHPSNTYVSRLADLLGMEAFNKGVGGERFFPHLALTKESFAPDFITVAYGTNDFSKSLAADFQRDCRDFLENLKCTYPGRPIFVISPVWRADHAEIKPCGTFSELTDYIRSVSESLGNTVFITGMDLLPHDAAYYPDGKMHPGDAGGRIFGNQLSRIVRSHLSEFRSSAQ